jgi:hypothetical protein
MHNLLPREQKDTLRKQYQHRVLSVGLALGSAVVILASVTLVPSLVAVTMEIRKQNEEAARLATVLAEQAGGEEPRSVLRRGTNVTQLLNAHKDKDTFSSILEDILEARDEGIVISSVFFDRSKEQSLVEGTATTRDALVQYTRRLESHPHFASTKLPISDLAESTNLSFQLTLGLAMGGESQN